MMRSAKECLEKAAQLDALAMLSQFATAAHYQGMALSWRRLARQAEWQDAHRALLDEPSVSGF